MPADWSSIWAGFGIVWAALLLYGTTIVWRLRRSRSKRESPHGKR